MKINIKSYPNSSKSDLVFEKNTNTYKAYIKKPAIRGLANKELLEIIAKKFNASKSQVKIISGYTSRKKIIEINNY